MSEHVGEGGSDEEGLTGPGPNLTPGEGSAVARYTTADWDRAVRRVILPGGRPSVMPSEDYRRMSNRELSDIVAYLRSAPAVDAEIVRPRFGPLGKVLLALGEIPLATLGFAAGERRGAPREGEVAEAHALQKAEARAIAR
ncbi:MAG: hypothetical protein AAF447_09140 [Myxococcota bacterium]